MEDHGVDDFNERRNSNTEYAPTKCRVTKPPPPKPANNPLKFIQVYPCPLFQKAEEQINQVEQIKKERKSSHEEMEDWQANLDNWKSSRRKRQEHIIERVIEVKKFEQGEEEKTRRKCKTFNEMMNERGKGRHKAVIPILEDHSNDWSDYGLKIDVSSMDEKAEKNQSNIEDDTNNERDLDNINISGEITKSNLDSLNDVKTNEYLDENVPKLINNCNINKSPIKPKDQYTYDSAIEDYRTRIKSKFNESILFNNSSVNSSNNINNSSYNLVPKGLIVKNKSIFDKPIEISHYESSSSKALAEDLGNIKSVRERLQNFEKNTDQSKNQLNAEIVSGSVKEKLQLFDNQNESDRNNNTDGQNIKNKQKLSESSNSSNGQEINLFVNKLNLYDKQLENIYGTSPSLSQDSFMNVNYPPSSSSTELMGLSSDKEDSEIHTADISCSSSHVEEEPEFRIDNKSISINDFQKSLVSSPLSENHHSSSSLFSHKSDSSNNTNTTNVFSHNYASLNSSNIKRFTELGLIAPEYYDVDNAFPLVPPKLEPPKVKPPPPPVLDDTPEVKISSWELKKDLSSQRSKFLGLLENEHSCVSREQKDGKKIDDEAGVILSRGESNDSGLDIDKGRLSSDTWCTTPSHERQDSEQINSSASEDEIMKREREIIEMVEKEEKSQNLETEEKELPKILAMHEAQSHDRNMFYRPTSPNFLDEPDSEVLKVEKELAELEQQELKRKRTLELFRENCLKNVSSTLRHSLDNIYDDHSPSDDCRKSMPELQKLQLEVNQSLYNLKNDNRTYANSSVIQHRKSLPNIPNINFNPKFQSYRSLTVPDFKALNEKMPNFQNYAKSTCKNLPDSRTPVVSKGFYKTDPEHGVKMKNNWSHGGQNYSKHWLYQEAELRRMQDNQANKSPWSQKQKSLPDAVIYSLTQKVQNKLPSNSPSKKSLTMLPTTSNKCIPLNTDYQAPLDYRQSVSHALPTSYPTSLSIEEGQSRMLSVSGKKKCSYCGNELGRGAAMIIESLCLFYHMECFKCCVCHVQLGNGLIGTDVRVRNEKLHCHNCYSSDDGLKYSCV